MVVAALWAVGIAVSEGIIASLIVDRPRIAATPIRSAIVVGMTFFGAMSSTIPVAAVVVPLTWTPITVLVWEVVVAGGMGLITSVALAYTWRRRQRRWQDPA